MQGTRPHSHWVCLIRAWPALASLLLVCALFAHQWFHLSEAGLLARFAMIPEGAGAWREVGVRSAETTSLESALTEAGISGHQAIGISELLKVQQWLGNRVSRIEVLKRNHSASELLAQVAAGRGISCDGMALVLEELATALGLPARRVQLYRSNFEPLDTHVLIEVWLDAHGWVALDPTFNLTFQDEHGGLLGVAAIRQRLAARGGGTVIPVYHGNRSYPARVEAYYLDWRALFSNAYVARACETCTWVLKLPPLRYWFGPVRLAFGEDLGVLPRHHNQLYFLTVVVLPLILGVLALAVVRRFTQCRGQ